MNVYDNDKRIIDDLKILINKNFIGKEIEIKFMNRVHKGTLINETKNTFEIIENGKIKRFIKNAIMIRVKLDEWSEWLNGKYFTQTLDERLRQKVVFYDNPLLR